MLSSRPTSMEVSVEISMPANPLLMLGDDEDRAVLKRIDYGTANRRSFVFDDDSGVEPQRGTWRWFLF